MNPTRKFAISHPCKNRKDGPPAHGYAVVHAAADRLETDFICLPRPIVRQEQPDGGPMLYRVRHTAKLWRKQERPKREQKVIEGNPVFPI